jgi:hypothetical protein
VVEYVFCRVRHGVVIAEEQAGKRSMTCTLREFMLGGIPCTCFIFSKKVYKNWANTVQKAEAHVLEHNGQLGPKLQCLAL